MLYQFIIDIGFKSVAGHPCLFIRVRIIAGNSYIVIIGIFVDDLLVTGNSVSEINKSERSYERALSLDRSRSPGILSGSWSHTARCKYINLLDCPDEVDSKLQAKYRAIVGSLMYLYQWTRPDLGFTVLQYKVHVCGLITQQLLQ